MTTGYIVQIHRDTGTVYVGTGGKVGTLPKIFNNSGRAKAVIRTYNQGYGRTRFQKDDIPNTVCIKIEGLEKGMRGSDATEYSWDKFLETDFSKAKSSIPNNPKAMYKIQLAPTGYTLSNTANTPQFVQAKRGQRQEKFGRTWSSAGAVRSHISGQVHRLYNEYKGAKVIEIEMNEDGLTPKQIKTYPIVDFYCASPNSRKLHDDSFHTKYTPTPENA